jgi:hypothetical protein
MSGNNVSWWPILTYLSIPYNKFSEDNDDVTISFVDELDSGQDMCWYGEGGKLSKVKLRDNRQSTHRFDSCKKKSDT